MLSEQLAALERAAEPYLSSDYRVVSQTETSLTLTRPRPRLSLIIFIILLIVLWPVAVIYMVYNRNQRDKVVCLRITSRGYIEETGDTLDADWRVSTMTVVIIVLSAIVATVLLLLLIRQW